MAIFTRILLGLCLFLLQDSCTSAAVLDFTSQLSIDPLFTKVIERLNNLEKENEVQRQEIKNLEASNAFQQKMIQTLESNVDNLNQEIEHMKTSATEETNQDISPSADVLAQTNGEVNVQDKDNEVNDVSSSYRIRRQEVEIGNVAFTAILTKPLTNLGLNQNILFNTVETNIGNAYNPHHGVFVAPVSGTYVFHVTIFALYNQEAWCKIVVNGHTKVGAFAHGESNYHDMGSQTLVVHLNQGDDVAIQNGRADDNAYGDVNRWTTFSGFLLRSDAELTSLNVIG